MTSPERAAADEKRAQTAQPPESATKMVEIVLHVYVNQLIWPEIARLWGAVMKTKEEGKKS